MAVTAERLASAFASGVRSIELAHSMEQRREVLSLVLAVKAEGGRMVAIVERSDVMEALALGRAFDLVVLDGVPVTPEELASLEAMGSTVLLAPAHPARLH